MLVLGLQWAAIGTISNDIRPRLYPGRTRGTGLGWHPDASQIAVWGTRRRQTSHVSWVGHALACHQVIESLRNSGHSGDYLSAAILRALWPSTEEDCRIFIRMEMRQSSSVLGHRARKIA